MYLAPRIYVTADSSKRIPTTDICLVDDFEPFVDLAEHFSEVRRNPFTPGALLVKRKMVNDVTMWCRLGPERTFVKIGRETPGRYRRLPQPTGDGVVDVTKGQMGVQWGEEGERRGL